MTETVLVPIDGSPLSHRALRYALDTFPDAEIVVLHVCDMYDPGYGADGEFVDLPPAGSEKWYEMEKQAAAEVLAEAEDIADEKGRPLTTDSKIGDPQRYIPDFAREHDIDHIVLGVHGREEEDRQMFGRVAESVVYRSPVSVTIIR